MLPHGSPHPTIFFESPPIRTDAFPMERSPTPLKNEALRHLKNTPLPLKSEANLPGNDS